MDKTSSFDHNLNVSYLSLPAAILKIREKDPRFAPAAFDFVRRSLDQSLRKLGRGEEKKPSHVQGQELLEGFRLLALAEFGPMAKTVLNDWGIQNCAQVGDIVFHLVQHGILGKSENDRPEDFQESWSFTEAFVVPFQPSKKPLARKKMRRALSPQPAVRRSRKSDSSSPKKG